MVHAPVSRVYGAQEITVAGLKAAATNSKAENSGWPSRPNDCARIARTTPAARQASPKRERCQGTALHTRRVRGAEPSMRAVPLRNRKEQASRPNESGRRRHESRN